MKGIDLLIYGATGFTGGFIVEALAKVLANNARQPLTWAVAGRNRAKLQNCLHNASLVTGIPLKHIECLEADIDNPRALEETFRKCRLVMNCTGPYSLLGLPVVKSCIATGTNYMDLSGEPLFMEQIMQMFHDQAREKNVTIVNSCGIDSIPADIGTAMLKANFDGTLNHVEHYLELWTVEKRFSYATWIALIEGYKKRDQLKQLRKEVFPKCYKPFKWNVSLKRRSYERNKFGYCVPFPGSDRSVVMRSQLERYTRLGERPVQFEAYYCAPSLVNLLGLAFLNTSIQSLSDSELGEKLLHKYSRFFSAGLFVKDTSPTREKLEKNTFRITQIGSGWSSQVRDHQASTMDKHSAVVIEGGDPAYLDTSVIAVHTALALLDKLDSGRLPSGVFTPASVIEPEELLPQLNASKIAEMNLENIKHVILVLSGKGGVGKSTVSAQVALCLQDLGHKVGLLDVDLCGPSIPRMFSLTHSKVEQGEKGWIPVAYHRHDKPDMKIMSIGFLINEQDTAIIWRGPKKNAMIKQFLSDVDWGELDYLVIDTPPGTSDEHISVVECLPNSDGALLVTTPQAVSIGDVRREITFCKKGNIPILGIVENMSGYVCEHCSECTNIFSSGGGEQLAEYAKIKFLAKIPIEPKLGESCDEGRNFIEHGQNSVAYKNIMKLTEDLVNELK